MFHAVGVRGFALLLGAFFAVTLLACSSLQSPESVVESYFKAAADNRAEEAIGYFSLEDVEENNLTAIKGKFMMIVGAQYAQIEGNGGLESVLTILVEQDDSTAEVAYEITYKNGETEKSKFSLVKTSGQWKIRLN